MKNPRGQIPALLALMAVLATSSHAQSVTSTPSAPLPAAAREEPVRLQEFTVPGNSDQSYVASESTTGTRVATKIADLPFVVNVITSEFLNDFDFFDIGSNLGYTSSLGQVDAEGNFNLRGFTATFYLWNGFYRLGVVDRVNIDRIEIIKGPNAAIYGQTSPAGLINIITKIPRPTPFEEFTYTHGSFDLDRLEASVNTPLGTLFGVRVQNLANYAWMDRKYDTQYEYLHERSFSDALELIFSEKTNLTTTFEWDKRLANTGDAEQLFNYNSATKSYYGTLAPINLARFSQGGPNERQNRELTSVDSVLESRFNDVWSVRTSAYYYNRHNSEIYNGISNEFDPVLGEVVGISTKPTRTILNEDGGAGQADLLAHKGFMNGAADSRFLFTLDWSEDWRYRHETQVPSYLNTFVSVQNPNAPNYNGVPDYSAWTIVTRDDRVRWDTDGIFGREQLTLFHDHLLLFAAMRHDQVTYNLNFGNQYSTKAPYAIATPGQVQHFVNSAYTPAGGANFKLTDTIALYGNYSQSFEPSAQGAKLGDPPLGNTRANGVDYGVKGNFLGGKLIFTLGGYYVVENGLKITVLNPDGTTNIAPAGTQNSKGVEADFTYQAADGLSILGGFGYVNARLENEGTNTNADGRRAPNIPIDNLGVAMRYDFGKLGLRGVAFHIGLVYYGISYPESTASDPVESGIHLPSYHTVEAGVSYTWTGIVHGAKFTNSVGFNVDNLTNEDYVDAKLTPGLSRGFYLHYTLRH